MGTILVFLVWPMTTYYRSSWEPAFRDGIDIESVMFELTTRLLSGVGALYPVKGRLRFGSQIFLLVEPHQKCVAPVRGCNPPEGSPEGVPFSEASSRAKRGSAEKIAIYIVSALNITVIFYLTQPP